MPVIVSTNPNKERLSISIHQPEKCGTQNTRILLLETEPYKGNFEYCDQTVSAWNALVVFRNHFDRLLSVWYHGCVDPRNQSGKPRAIWKTHPDDTFRDFITRIGAGLYARDIHVLPYTASHQEEFYSLYTGKFKYDVQVADYLAPATWTETATYLRLENLNVVFHVFNKWLGISEDTCKDLWSADLKGNHHIDYSSEGTPMMDATVHELLEYKKQHGSFPSADEMWDDDLYSIIESCAAYQHDHNVFSSLGLLARHGTDLYNTGKSTLFQVKNPPHEMWKRYSSLYEKGGPNWEAALDEGWESFRQEPYFWPIAVNAPDFWWERVRNITPPEDNNKNEKK